MLINDNFLRLLVWTIADGTFDNNRIRFKLSKPRKIIRLITLLNSLGYQYHHVECKQERIQTMIPNRISLSVETSQEIFKALNFRKECPRWFLDLNKNQSKLVFEEYSITDGCWTTGNPNTLEVTSINYHDIEVLKDINEKYFKCSTWEHSRVPKSNFNSINPTYMLRIHQLRKAIS